MIRFFKYLAAYVLFLVPLAQAQESSTKSLADLRAEHKTELVKKNRSDKPVTVPPDDAPLTLVKYKTKIGEMSAYLSKPEVAEDGSENQNPEKGPAIVWLTGGVPPAGPSAYLWESTKTSNEQSARIYRLRGIAMMFPIVRGKVAENPGQQEWFYGEVDDVISACEFLRKQPNVDPERVYIGGHSGGGTLALLAAASTDQVAGVFAFGPTDTEYERDELPHKFNDKERHLRWPIKHLDRIKVPTYVIGGEIGDLPAMQRLAKANKNKLVQFFTVENADHFNVIHPANSVLSRAVLDSKDGKLSIDREKLTKSYLAQARRNREANDLENLADIRSRGVTFDQPKELAFYLLAGKKEAFSKEVFAALKKAGFAHNEPKKYTNSDDKPYYVVDLTKTIDLNRLDKLFAATAAAESIAEKYRLQYDDWTTN